MAHGHEKCSRLTRFEQWTRIQERTGRVIDDLTPPCLPVELEYIWLQYIEIRKGAATVGYNDIDSYCRVSGSVLSAWEAEIMLQIDMLRGFDNGG